MPLAQLAQARVYYGDFDWPGLRVGNYVMREFGAEPWRFGVADYIAAVRAAAVRGTLWQGSRGRMGHRVGGGRLSVIEKALGQLLQDCAGTVAKYQTCSPIAPLPQRRPAASRGSADRAQPRVCWSPASFNLKQFKSGRCKCRVDGTAAWLHVHDLAFMRGIDRLSAA
jgi:hypothetical protein